MKKIMTVVVAVCLTLAVAASTVAAAGGAG